MSSTKPTRGPAREKAAAAAGSTAPTQLPPMTMTAATEARPRELTADEVAIATRASAADAMPTMEPPAAESVKADGVGAWISDKRVGALWSQNQDRNTWVSVNDVGWKRLANGSDSAIMALTILSAHAKQMQTSYSYREEADGMIHECYVW